jgi:hypothetical protein
MGAKSARSRSAGVRAWARECARSEEKVALVGLAIRSAVSPEAHLLGIVSAEFVAKELAVWSTPRLQLAIHNR